jgi:outer membrane biosynthesis protein TonB
VVPVELIIADATNVAAAAPSVPQEDLFVSPAPPEAVQPPMPDIPEPAPVEAKMPEIKIAPDPKPAPRNSINDLLNQLTQPERNSTAKPAPRATEAAGASNMATASLADALRSQVRNCWSPMTGAPNPEDQVVTFSLRLNRNGTVAGIEVLTYTNNAYGAAAVEAASRAIYQCAPYRLPLERYAQWREFRPLRFDPRQMMGR